ncbi:hypothetical protein RJ639_009358 [Escallonia herrerae]|uniref:Uncharacterized protein n=1 Tax=Escallonia herrerae TaxID=1293975 RepID=A0AA89ASH7_9ASTE|nr:hypothetical protein RJ639_009358 [Escallonia herrerae]
MYFFLATSKIAYVLTFPKPVVQENADEATKQATDKQKKSGRMMSTATDTFWEGCPTLFMSVRDQVARNLGKTLREFQPTIRELQDVSREFKSTLEREIGLDDIQNPTQGNYSSKTTSTTPSPSPTSGSADSQVTVDTNGLSSPKSAYSSEDYLKITEEQLKASAAVQQKSVDAPGEGQLESQAQSQGLSILMSLGNSLPFPQPLPLGPNVYSYATAIRNTSRSCSRDASNPEAAQKRDVNPQKRSIAKKIKKSNFCPLRSGLDILNLPSPNSVYFRSCYPTADRNRPILVEKPNLGLKSSGLSWRARVTACHTCVDSDWNVENGFEPSDGFALTFDLIWSIADSEKRKIFSRSCGSALVTSPLADAPFS